MSIRSALKKRILNDMVGSTIKKIGSANKGNVMLVLDKMSSKIISSCCRANELIDAGVIAIESIYVNREAIPSYSAMYFLDNSNPNDLDSTHLMVNDFTAGNNMYEKAYIYYTSPISDDLMDIIIDGGFIDKIGCLVELNVNFTTVENRVFTLNDPYPLPYYYWSDKEVIKSHMRSDISKLVSLCTVINAKPKIRYDSNSMLSQRFAELLSKNLDIRKKELISWAPDTRAQLLVVDRGVDAITPLMHEFTYQAALYDLCGNKGEILYINNEELTSEQKINPNHLEHNDLLIEKRSVIVNEAEDSIWAKYRHDHIGLVGSKLGSDLKRFKKENKMAQYQESMIKQRRRQGIEEEEGSEKIGSKDDLSPQQMAEALQDFHKYSREMARFSKHTELSKECLGKIENNRLKEIATIEQELATGFNDDGDSINKKKLVSRISSLCNDPSVNIESKLRLIMLFLLTQGEIQQQVRKELLRNINPVCASAIDKLTSLGYAISSSSYLPPKYSSIRRKEGEARSEEIQFIRYVPLLWELGNLLVLNKLKPDAFPYVGGGGEGDDYYVGSSARRGKRGGDRESRGNERDESDATTNAKPYYIIYVIGGITYSEAKAINEIAAEHNTNILLGGSTMMTPRQFLCNLADVSKYTWLQQTGPVLGENMNDIKNTAKYMKSLYRHSLLQSSQEDENLFSSNKDVNKLIYHDIDDGYDNVAIIDRNKDTLKHADDSIVSISEIAEADVDGRLVRTNVSDRVRELLVKGTGKVIVKKPEPKKKKPAPVAAKKDYSDDSDDDDIEMAEI